MNIPVTEISEPTATRSNGSTVLFGARPVSGEHVSITAADGARLAGVFIRREDRQHWREYEEAFRASPDGTDVVVPFAFHVQQ